MEQSKRVYVRPTLEILTAGTPEYTRIMAALNQTDGAPPGQTTAVRSIHRSEMEEKPE